MFEVAPGLADFGKAYVKVFRNLDDVGSDVACDQMSPLWVSCSELELHEPSGTELS